MRPAITSDAVLKDSRMGGMRGVVVYPRSARRSTRAPMTRSRARAREPHTHPGSQRHVGVRLHSGHPRRQFSMATTHGRLRFCTRGTRSSKRLVPGFFDQSGRTSKTRRRGTSWNRDAAGRVLCNEAPRPCPRSRSRPTHEIRESGISRRRRLGIVVLTPLCFLVGRLLNESQTRARKG